MLTTAATRLPEHKCLNSSFSPVGGFFKSDDLYSHVVMTIWLMYNETWLCFYGNLYIFELAVTFFFMTKQ